jgi:hypothetical protein
VSRQYGNSRKVSLGSAHSQLQNALLKSGLKTWGDSNMSPERKFNAIVLSITIAIMASVLTYIPSFEDRVAKPLEIAISIFTGAGLYEALAKFIEFHTPTTLV